MKTMYMLEPIFDVKAFEGYCFADDDEQFAIDSLFRESALREGKTISLAAQWQPPSVIGRVKEINDYPAVYPHPAFSTKAIESLGDLLTSNGELLPIAGALPGVMLFHVHSLCQLLDVHQSDIVFLDDEKTELLAIEHFVLDDEKAASFSAEIFRIPQLPTEVFVSERFVQRVIASNLKGLQFVKAWPVEPGVIWRQNYFDGDTETYPPIPAEIAPSHFIINAMEHLDDELRSQLEASIAEAMNLVTRNYADGPDDIVAAIERWLLENRLPQSAMLESVDDEESESLAIMLGALYGNQFARRFGWIWSVVDRSDIDGSTLAIRDQAGNVAIYPIIYFENLLANPTIKPKLALCFDMVESGDAVQDLLPNTRGEMVDLMESLHTIVP